MPDRVNEYSAWEADYRMRGTLWSGNPAELPELVPGSKVLELGCGNGKSLSGMSDRGWEITGLDCSLHALALCQASSSQGTNAIHLVTGDACDLPFRDGSFDAVFSIHLTGHLLGPGRSQVSSEISRVLGKGGTLYFRDFETGDFRCGKGKPLEPFTFRRGTGTVTHYFTTNEVDVLFAYLHPVSTEIQKWSMRIRGITYQRAEIVAVFQKNV